jgi:hypothetical protein
VLTHKREVRLDVGAKPGRSSWFGKHARQDVGPTSFDDFDHDLPDEVVLAGEVVANDALADADTGGDARQRCLGEADLGNGIDRGIDDLLATRVLDKRPPLSLGVGHHRPNLRYLAARPDIHTSGQHAC